MKKKLILLAISCLLIVGCSNSEIEENTQIEESTQIVLNDYGSVNFTGENGSGFVLFGFDSSKLRFDLTDSYKGSPSNASTDITNILATISWEIDKKTELSNGDEITISINWDNELASELDYSFSAKDETFTVIGLQDS